MLTNEEVKSIFKDCYLYFTEYQDADYLDNQVLHWIDYGQLKIKDKYKCSFATQIVDALVQEFHERNEAQGIEENGGEPVPD
jgi:hypothetical protein